MGHRATVAYKHDDRITVHYSHWGAGKLHDSITEEEPLGSGSYEPGYVNSLLSALEDSMGEEVGIEGELTKPQDDTPVEAAPIGVVDTVEEWVEEYVDGLFHESVYLVDTTQNSWEVRSFAPIYWNTENWDRGSMGDYFLLFETPGEESHDVWDGMKGRSWEKFRETALEIYGDEYDLFAESPP